MPPSGGRVRAVDGSGAVGTASDDGATWLIDAYNVIGARPDGWWRDRMLALARLCDAVAQWLAPDDVAVVVVDGWPRPEVPEGRRHGVTVRYARRRGPDGADRAITELVWAAEDPARVHVVTSDAGLRRQVTAAGVGLVGAGTFRRWLDAAGPAVAPDGPLADDRDRRRDG
jgi:predicted RNA-binding protein with PIN domain